MKIILLSIILAATMHAGAQLKTTTKCATIVVDLLDGKVNGAEPKFTPSQIKGLLPCFTSEEPENEESKCGGGVFYKDNDIYFYTGRDYIEIREKFKGKLTIPVMGAARNGLFQWLGNPKLKDTNFDVYTTSYGMMIVYFNKANKVNKIQFTTKSMEEIQLCQ